MSRWITIKEKDVFEGNYEIRKQCPVCKRSYAKWVEDFIKNASLSEFTELFPFDYCPFCGANLMGASEDEITK